MNPRDRLQNLVEGRDACLVARLESGFVVMSETQYLPGYCLLLANPWVGQLNDLEGASRLNFLADLAQVGDAIKQVTNCKRLNYAIYGNVDPFLHAHIWPRYEEEDPSLATLPPLSFPAEFRSKPEFAFGSPEHESLRQRIRAVLTTRYPIS